MVWSGHKPIDLKLKINDRFLIIVQKAVLCVWPLSLESAAVIFSVLVQYTYFTEREKSWEDGMVG